MRALKEILRTGLLPSEVQEIADGGPLQVRCASVDKGKRCLEIFDAAVDVDLAVYSGACPKHGRQNFCITIQGQAGVAAFVATDQDFKDLEESRKPAKPEVPIVVPDPTPEDLTP